jgi:hypothetical protein
MFKICSLFFLFDLHLKVGYRTNAYIAVEHKQKESGPMDMQAVEDRTEDDFESAKVVELGKLDRKLTTPHSIDHIAEAQYTGPDPNDH